MNDSRRRLRLERLEPRFAPATVTIGSGTGVHTFNVAGWNFHQDNANFPTTSSAFGFSEAAMTVSQQVTTSNGGFTSQKLGDGFDGVLSWGVGTTKTINSHTYHDADGIVDITGNTITGDPIGTGTDGTSFGGLLLSQQNRIFALNATDPIIRSIITINNPTGEAITRTIGLFNNYGSDSNTRITSTSSGDDTFTNGVDRWVATFQNYSGGLSSDPRLLLVMQGPGTVDSPYTAGWAGNGDDNPNMYYDVTVQPGETVRLMVFMGVHATKTASQNSGMVFDSNSTVESNGLLAGLTEQQISEIANWNLQTPSTLSVASVSKAEGDSGLSNMVFTITRSGSLDQREVNFATQDGTAIGGADFTSVSGSILFAEGQQTATISVPIFGNPVIGLDKSFTVTFSGTDVTNASATGTIVDDDRASLLFGVDTDNNLVRFHANIPELILGTTHIGGTAGNEAIVAIDFRPSTGQLYGLGYNFQAVGGEGQLYTIDPGTGAATAVGGRFSMPNSIGSTLNAATSFGFDFNPVVDLIRVVSGGRDNFRLNPDTGVIAGADTILTPGGSQIGGAAYSNNFDGATSTTLYDINFASDTLVIQGDGTSPNGGVLTTVGPLGINASALSGFDIETIGEGAQFALAAMSTGGLTTDLYRIDLATGAATSLGIINGAPMQLRALAIAPSVDLALTKENESNDDNVDTGEVIRYTLTYSNRGFVDATGVSISELVPANAVFDLANSSAGWQDAIGNALTDGAAAGTVAKFVAGTVAGGGATQAVTFAVRVLSTLDSGVESISNSASIAHDGVNGMESDLSNNTASDSDSIAASPDLEVSIVDDPVSALRGGTTRYLINYSNVGNQDAAGGVITMTLPENTFFNPSLSTGIWMSLGEGVYQLSVGNLEAGAAPQDAVFAVTLNAVVPGGYKILSTTGTIADDGSNGVDPNVADNTDSETTPLYQGIYAVAPGVSLPSKRAAAPVQVFDIASGQLIHSINAYESTYRDSIRVAVGDINGDGYDDIITSTRTGSGRVRVFDGVTGERFEGPFSEIAAFSEAGAKGAFVAAGDVTGDGRDDIIVGSGQGARGAGKIRVFDGVTGQAVTSAERQPFGNFRGGVRVAVGDINGDGLADIVASQGYGGNDVLVTSGVSSTVLLDLDIGGSRYRGGVFVAVADLDNDGFDDLIAGRDRGKTVVETFDGVTGALEDTIVPFASNYRLGARVAVADVNLDGVVDIIVGSGGRNLSSVKIFNGDDLSIVRTLQAYSSNPTGALFVSGTSPVPARMGKPQPV